MHLPSLLDFQTLAEQIWEKNFPESSAAVNELEFQRMVKILKVSAQYRDNDMKMTSVESLVSEDEEENNSVKPVKKPFKFAGPDDFGL